MIIEGNSIDLINNFKQRPDLIITDPPYAFGGDCYEHELSASVAIVLRESAKILKPNSYMLIMCASSWRSINYMVESLRGIAKPSRIGTWVKPLVKTKVSTSGWAWSSVNVVVFKKGKPKVDPSKYSDHIICLPMKTGRTAELPREVADWMVGPYAKVGGLMLDPFAGSGSLLHAAERHGMNSIGFEINPRLSK